MHKGRPKRVEWKMFIRLIRDNATYLWFCFQIATLGLLRQLVTYSPATDAIAGYPTLLLWMARVLSVITLLVLTLLIANPRANERIFSRSVLAGASAALVIGVLLAVYGAASMQLYCLSQVLIGISHAWILAAWAHTLAQLDTKARTWVIGVSGLLAVLLFSAMTCIPINLRAFCFLLFALGSSIPLVITAQSNSGVTSPSESSQTQPTSVGTTSTSPVASMKAAFAKLPTELIVLMASYAMLFRLLTFLELPVPTESLQFCTNIIRIIGMLLLLAYYAKRKFAPNMRQMLIPLMALTVMGLVLIPITNNNFALISVAMVEASWTFFYVLMWVVLFEVGNAGRTENLTIFLIGWTIMNAILVAAAPIAAALEAQVSAGALSLTALALMLVYMLSVALLLMRKPNTKSAEAASAKRVDGEGTNGEGALPDALTNWQEGRASFYRAIAASYELTPRETEVFELLAQGYSLPAIEEQFVLSHSTVKGHARSIYRKFNVSTKQELIAAVEAMRHAEGASHQQSIHVNNHSERKSHVT